MIHIKRMLELPESKIIVLYHATEISLVSGIWIKKQVRMTSVKCQRVPEMQNFFKCSLQAVILKKR